VTPARRPAPYGCRRSVRPSSRSMKSNIVKAASIGMPACCRRKRRRFVYSSCQHRLKRYVRKTCNSAHQSFGSYGKRPNWEHILQATFRQCADESYRSFDRSRPIHQPCRMGCAIPGVLIRVMSQYSTFASFFQPRRLRRLRLRRNSPECHLPPPSVIPSMKKR